MLPEEQSTTMPVDKSAWFTTTHWTMVLSARRSDSPQAAEALEKLCRTYWYPLYAYVRRRGHAPHDAQDLTQEFFARLLGNNYLGAVDREKGKFRSFLLASLNHFLSNERDRANAAKRGGGRTVISLDETVAEGQYQLEPASDVSPEKVFEQRWAVTLLDQAFKRLREEFAAAGKAELFDQLKPFLAEGASSGDYASVGAQLHMTPSAVAVAVHRLRQRYGELVRAEIANTVASPADIEDEMRHLLAVLAQ
jgi:RNA polymerase sigma-70 factor (ECF subfamily)